MGAASPASLHQRLDTVLPVLDGDLNADAVEELREAIDSRVAAQLAAIEAGLDVCPVGEGEGGDECEECLVDSCLDELTACEEDADCECMLECDDDEELCLPECGLTDVPPELDAFFACVVSNCADACGL
jgi:hypothetical protein